MNRKRSSLWAISLYAGDTPLTLAPFPGMQSPLITRESVWDIPAQFVADPFMVWHEGALHLFCEVMNGSNGVGEIGLASSFDGMNWEYKGTVLREPFHLSYPHLYKWGGEIYMVPETISTGYVQAYRSKKFPFEWDEPRPLMPGHFADSTIFHHDGWYWMFACDAPGHHDSLRLYFANEPFGSWKEHPMSPLITGNRSIARPAGKMIHWNGMPLRFAQDCVPVYGTKVRAFEILELTPTNYRERERPESPIFSPGGEIWNSSGMHHIDAHRMADGRWLAAVDGYCLFP